MTAATVEIESLRAAESRGYDVKLGLANANEQLATSTALYRDAVKDSIANTELDTKLKGANLQLSIAQATASGNHYTAMAAEARALGDVALATHYEIEAKQESIRVLKLKLQLDKLQQDADLLTIEIKRKLINTETDEGKQKLKLLDIEVQMIKIRQAGNQAVLDQIRVIDAEVVALRNGTNAREASGKSIEKDNALRGKNIEVIDKTTDALKRELEARLAAAGAAATAEYNSLPETLKRKKAEGTLTSADLGDAQNNFNAAKNNLTQIQNAPGGTFGLEAVQDATRRYNEARSVLESATSGGGSAKPAAGSTNTVNINIGGVSTPINVTSAADASNLQSVLKQLATAQGRSI
jgi:fructose-specific component phosphotransferase system IIB-like protein